jgi:CBS domain-containing protein
MDHTRVRHLGVATLPVIRDIMSKVVISVRPDNTLMDAVKILTKHHISGAPVVTRKGELVGFISESNLMDVLFEQAARKAPVSDYMSPDVHAVDSQDPLATAATMLAMYGLRRVPVVENGRFIGVVTRRDLLAYALHDPEPLSEPILDLIPQLAELH